MAVVTAVALVATSLVLAPFAAAPANAAAADLDLTFGGDGRVTEGFGTQTIHAVTQQGDGKLVAAGGYAKVARYNDDGSLDETFAGDGVAELPLINPAIASAVAVDGAGRILVSGSNTSSHPVMVARLTPEGRPDPTFDGDGLLEVQLGSGDAHLNAVASQADGKIVVAGYARGTGSSSHHFVAARFNEDGSFDTTFGTGGTQILAVNSYGIANDLALQDDGAIVLTGYTAVDGVNRFTTARLLARDGSLDESFGRTGIVETLFHGESEARGVEVQPDGKIVLGGRLANTSFAFARLHGDGTLDLRFNDGGTNVVRPAGRDGVLYGVDLAPNGKIVGNGWVRDIELGADHALVRLDENGFVDTDFGVGGSAVVDFGGSEEARALVVQSDSKLVTAGSNSTIARLLGDHVPPVQEATGRIAFSSNRSGNFDIWVADDTDGASAVNVTNHAANDYDPAFSPDGSKIAFSSDREGTRRVWYVNADGSGLAAVPFALWDADPEWSPDGTKIVFTRDFGGQDFDLMVFDTTAPAEDGVNPKRLFTEPGYNDGFPNWSPDGSTIVFRSVDRTNGSTQLVRSVPAAGGEITSLVAVTGEINTTPSWSPDGRRILFSSDRTGGGDIYVMQSDGSEQQQVTADPGREDLPEWSPDGIRIAFTRVLSTGTPAIVVADANGRNELVFSAEGTSTNAPSWVGDGLTLTVSESTTKASPSHLPLGDLVLTPNALSNPQGLPLDDLDVAGLPLDDLDVAGLPLDDLDVAGLPLDDLDVAGLPLDDLDVAGLPLDDLDVAGLPLDDLDVAGLPLPAPGGWETILIGTKFEGVPLQNVRLIDVLALVDDPTASETAKNYIRNLCVCDIDWSQSPLATLGAVPLALGRVTFAEITLPASDAGWCSRFEALGFANCGAAFGGLGGTVFGFQIAGGHLGELPLNALPIGSIKLDRSALLGYSLVKIENEIGLERSPLGSIRLNELPDPTLVADCTNTSIDCATTTIAAAGDAGALQPGAEVRHLGSVQDGGFRPVDRFAGFSLGEVVFTLLPIPQTPIEDLSYESLQLHRYGGDGARRLDYQLSYVHGDASVSDATAAVTLPQSFAYIPGTASITVVGGPTAGSRPLPDPTMSGSTLTWVLEKTVLDPGTAVRLDFAARPGLKLGKFVSSAVLSGTGLNESAAGQAPVAVGENFEPGRESDGPAVAKDTLYLNHISRSGDIDTFRYPVPLLPNDPTKAAVGARVQVYLSHLTHDVDLVGFLPAGLRPADPARTVVPRISLRGEPVVPPSLAPTPVADTAVTADTGVTKGAEQTVNDVPLRTDLAVGAISASHGLYDELVELIVPEGAKPGDQFVIQINGYNGSYSDLPHLFRVREIGLPKLPPCAARTRPYSAQSLPPAMRLPSPTLIRPTADAAPTETLVLVAPGRLYEQFGDGAAEIIDAVKDPLFLDRADVRGQLVSLDPDPLSPHAPQLERVATAFAEWDKDPCGIAKANDVVVAINALIDALLVDGEDYALRSVVVIGSDEVIPHHRIADTTRKFNERLYASSLAFTTRSGADDAKSNALLSAVANGYVVSDAAYGDLAPYVFPGGFVSVPQLAVGRLVETPAEMAAQVSRFVGYNGQLEPKTAAIAGYDFVTDNARATDAALAAAGVADREMRADDTWTAADLVDTIKTTDGSGTEVSRDLINVNGHYNHHLQQPAAGPELFATTSQDPADVTLDDVPALTGRGIFTMSCHTALNVADVLIGAPTDAQRVKLADWPQAYGSRGAAFLVGSSGYGYGDRYTLGYGERVVTSFAEGLTPGSTVAEAYINAQQEYFAGLGVNGVYDNKVLQETMLFGLPMFRIAGAAPATTGAAVTTATPTTDAGTGLLASDISYTPNLVERPQSDGTSFFQDGDELVQLTQDNPITARGDVDVTQDGLIATGAIVTSTTFTARSGFRPSISRPTVDLAAREPSLQPDDVFFPANLQRVGTAYLSDGMRQDLVVMSTQFQGAGLDDAGRTVGNLKTFSNVTNRVFYVPPTQLQEGDAPPTFSIFESEVVGNELQVRVQLARDGAAPTKQVLVLFTEIIPGQVEHQSRQLWLTHEGSNVWTGTATVQSANIELFAQAVNARGLVGISLNKTAAVGDAAPPIVSITTPASGGVYTVGQPVVADYSCVDARTGKPTPTCEGTPADGAAVDTSTPGEKTFTVTAADASGTITTRAVHYSVRYTFEGFFDPVENPPIVNNAKAGQTVPLKWRLKDAGGGLYGGLTASDATILFRQVPCPGGDETTVPDLLLIETPVTWDPVAQHYIAIIKTPKDLAGTCQELRVSFYGDDGSTQTANFQFR